MVQRSFNPKVGTGETQRKMVPMEEDRKIDPALKRLKRPSLTLEPFVGMWRDRDDMADSVRWVREIREREWTRVTV